MHEEEEEPVPVLEVSSLEMPSFFDEDEEDEEDEEECEKCEELRAMLMMSEDLNKELMKKLNLQTK